MRKLFLFICSFLISNTNIFATEFIKTDPLNAIKSLKSEGKTIITFVGYSGQGYKDLKGAMKKAEKILNLFDPSDVIINIGVTPEGIGQVYCIAKSMGFRTSGIVSSRGEKYLNPESTKCVDTAFIINDSLWGGRDENGALTPTSFAMVGVSDGVVRLGGGEIAHIEAEEALLQGKDTIEIEMEAGTKQYHEKYLD